MYFKIVKDVDSKISDSVICIDGVFKLVAGDEIISVVRVSYRATHVDRLLSLYTIYTHPSYRRNRYATHLMTHVINYFYTQNKEYKLDYLDVRSYCSYYSEQNFCESFFKKFILHNANKNISITY